MNIAKHGIAGIREETRWLKCQQQDQVRDGGA
jgi:hypothetical protein